MDALKNNPITIDEVQRDLIKTKRIESKRKKHGHSSRETDEVQCKFYGKKHQREKRKCPAFGKNCKKCGKQNHFAKVQGVDKKKWSPI